MPDETFRRPLDVFLALALLILVPSALAQLPKSGTLSDADRPLFRAEVSRVEALLVSAKDKGAITYQMARTWASAEQWPETLEWLRKVAALRQGLDPSRDSVFAELRGSREFDEILSVVREATPPVSHSLPAFQVREGDLAPESVAYDKRRKQFYFGSMKKGKLIRCSASGSCTQVASDPGVVLGIKAEGNSLWVLSNLENESALIRYELPSARVAGRYRIAGPGHNFNDLAIAPDGDVYLTDTRAGAVWHLASGASTLTKLPGRFEFANGIALSPNGRLLYVSTFPDGITIVELPSHAAAPISRPQDLCLFSIDGLYFYRGSLIAIQNGFMTPRVVRLRLTRDLHAIDRIEVLERRHPLFDGVTTGVIVGDELFYMANIQDDKKTGFDPIQILKVHL